MKLFYVTGTKHGSHIRAKTEGDARRAFHEFYSGESIVCLMGADGKAYQPCHCEDFYS